MEKKKEVERARDENEKTKKAMDAHLNRLECLENEKKTLNEKLRESNSNLGSIINMIFEQNDPELLGLLESRVTFKEETNEDTSH